MPSTPFVGEVAESWQQLENSVRYTVRDKLSWEVVEPYIQPDHVQKVLDIGGGTGAHSARFARLGKRVILLEPSHENLVRARQRFVEDLTPVEARRIEIVHGDMSALGRGYRIPFDAIVAHGVAMYQPDPSDFWQRALGYLRSGGVLSVLESGYDATAKDVRQTGGQKAFDYFQNNKKYINGLGIEARAFTFEDIEQTLTQLGAVVIDRAGIRFDADKYRMPVAQYGQAKFLRLLEIERGFMRHPERMHEGQMLQVIARKS